MNHRLSPRTLRFDSAPARIERLQANAIRHGVALNRMVLPAEGMVVTESHPALHYLEWPGPAVTPDVLMLHGGGLHAHTFDVLGNLLSGHARCIALDLRGHGDSGWCEPTGYGSAAIADDIDTVCEALALEVVVIVGHSLGGMGAMVWAARARPNLAGLVILDVAPEMGAEGTGAVNAFVELNPTFANMEEVDEFLATSFPGSAGADGMAANLRWGDDGRLGFKYDTGQFAGMNLALGDAQRDVVRQIGCPTRILRGVRSKVISAGAAAELAALIPGATWGEVPYAGHTIQSSNPTALAAEVVQFLSVLNLLPREGSPK